MKTRDITFIGVSIALFIACKKAGAYFLPPNIELISALVMLYTIFYGKKTLLIIGVFIAVEMITEPIGVWWVSYLYVWPLLVGITALAARLLRNQPDASAATVYVVILALYGLLFGMLTSVPNFILFGPGGGVAYIISGIPFDLAHAAGNFAFGLMVFVPIYLYLKSEKGKKLFAGVR